MLLPFSICCCAYPCDQAKTPWASALVPISWLRSYCKEKVNVFKFQSGSLQSMSPLSSFLFSLTPPLLFSFQNFSLFLPGDSERIYMWHKKEEKTWKKKTYAMRIILVLVFFLPCYLSLPFIPIFSFLKATSIIKLKSQSYGQYWCTICFFSQLKPLQTSFVLLAITSLLTLKLYLHLQ